MVQALPGLGPGHAVRLQALIPLELRDRPLRAAAIAAVHAAGRQIPLIGQQLLELSDLVAPRALAQRAFRVKALLPGYRPAVLALPGANAGGMIRRLHGHHPGIVMGRPGDLLGPPGPAHPARPRAQARLGAGRLALHGPIAELVGQLFDRLALLRPAEYAAPHANALRRAGGRLRDGPLAILVGKRLQHLRVLHTLQAS